MTCKYSPCLPHVPLPRLVYIVVKHTILGVVGHAIGQSLQQLAEPVPVCQQDTAIAPDEGKE